MLWANFLHFYQPYNQQDDILNRIVNECYIPLIEGLLKNKDSRTIINISGALTKILVEKGYKQVVYGIRDLVSNGQAELTGSAMYHAFLPLLPESEIERQIHLNEEENRKHFGPLFNPTGFFSPEMSVSDNVLSVVSRLGYKWISASDLSYGEGSPKSDRIYKDKKSGLFVFFRNKRVSSLVLSGVVRTGEDLLLQTKDIQSNKGYWFTVMDAETFGHHRIGHEKFLFNILESKEINTLTASDLLLKDYDIEEVDLRPSTWTNEEQDFWLDREHQAPTTAKSFILWRDPENPIHKLQWEFVDFVMSTVNNYKDKASPSWISARDKLDKAIASDQFWWASAKPWWSLEMIESGAYYLKDVLTDLNVTPEAKQTADKYYRAIVDKAFEWQRTGYIRHKHLENSSTYMRDPFNKRSPAEWYNQIVLEFEAEMKSASEKQEYEKAIKWRDALTKLKSGTDIYDVLHVVDELWTARNIPAVKPFLAHSWEEFSQLAKDHFRDVKDISEFNKWKDKK